MLTLVLLAVLSQESDEIRADDTPKEVVDVLNEFQQEVGEISVRYQSKVKPLAEKRDKELAAKAKVAAEKLRKLQDIETKAGNLEAAVKIKRVVDNLSTDVGKPDARAVRKQIPPTAKEFKGNQYALIPEKTTWHRAKELCEKMGGHLATVTSTDEMAFVGAIAGGQYVWLGATDESREGTWEWITGEPWTSPTGGFTNTGDVEHWLCMETPTKWNDWTPGHRIAFVCEWE